MNELPARRRINKIVIGTNGAIGATIIIGLGGQPELMMKGGLRGHHGRISLTTGRKSLRQVPTSGEWDGSQPEKTWRDRRTYVPSEKHGMLLWRALTGDAKLLISHFRDEELLRWDAGRRFLDVLAQAHKHIVSSRTRMISTTPSTSCTVSATRRCSSSRMWPGPAT